MSRILLSIAAVCVLLFPASGAMAAPAPDSGTAKVQAPQDKPAKTDSRVTVVSVTLDGSDSVGARLGMKLKEAFNSSNLFSLSEADSPKLRILVDTKSEFPSRPGVGRHLGLQPGRRLSALPALQGDRYADHGRG